MTVEQLESELADLNSQRDALKQKARELQQELDKAKAEAMAARVLAQMSDAERAAIAQVVSAGSVESGEAFGKIGN